MSTYFCETLPDGNCSASSDWKLSSFLSPKATDSFHSHPTLKQKTHSLFKNVGIFAVHGLFRLKSKWNTSALKAGPKRKNFAMNGTSIGGLQSHLPVWEVWSRFSHQLYTPRPPNAPCPLGSIKMICKIYSK